MKDSLVKLNKEYKFQNLLELCLRIGTHTESAFEKLTSHLLKQKAYVQPSPFVRGSLLQNYFCRVRRVFYSINFIKFVFQYAKTPEKYYKF